MVLIRGREVTHLTLASSHVIPHNLSLVFFSLVVHNFLSKLFLYLKCHLYFVASFFFPQHILHLCFCFVFNLISGVFHRSVAMIVDVFWFLPALLFSRCTP